MSFDPNDPGRPRDVPRDPNAPVVEGRVVDPVTGREIGPTETLTFAEWCAADPSVVDADAAQFDRLYPEPPEVVVEAADMEGRSAPAPTAAESAFVRFFGPSSEQKMDRATLDLRMQTLVDQPDPVAPPDPPVA